MVNRLVGESARIREVRDLLQEISGINFSVLIQGESGTGKALVAHIIHETGPRSRGPFRRFDCAVVAPNLQKFETANHGTIFLERIDRLPVTAQGRLLHVLEEGTLLATHGERGTIQVDVRVVAATDQDLERTVAAGQFREDLYYRLNVVPIMLPPLRERRGDVVMLAEHFLAEACERFQRPLKWLTADAQAALVQHHWPGNVRELRRMVERAARLTDAPAISAEALGLATD
jgi:two-component system nitrogen regulation response regulator GlnG